MSSIGSLPTKSLKKQETEAALPQENRPKPKPILYKYVCITNKETLNQQFMKRAKGLKWSVQELEEEKFEINSSDLKKLGLSLKASKITKELLFNVTREEDIKPQNLKKFGQNLKGLKNIKNIGVDFYNWEIKSQEFNGLFAGLKRLGSIQNLKMSLKGSKITDDKLFLLKKYLKKVRSLEQFNIDLLWCKSITDEAVHQLLKCLKRLPFLKDLDFMASEFFRSSKTFANLDQSLGRCVKLQKLNFLLTELTEEEWVGFGKSLASLTSLRDLTFFFLRSETLNNTAITVVGKSLSKLLSLKKIKLWVHGCENFDDKSMKILENGLGTTFESIDMTLQLMEGEVTDVGFSSLKELIAKQKSLVEFKSNFLCKEVSNKGFGSLIEGLETQKHSLQNMRIDFLGSKITDMGLSILGEKLKTFTSLKQIKFAFFGCQEIIGTSLESFGECLGKLTHLEDIDLTFRNHSITQEMIQKLKKELKKAFPHAKLSVGN